MSQQSDPHVVVLQGRLSYPSLFKPNQSLDENGNPQGEPKYSCAVLLDKQTAATTIAKCKAIIKAVCETQWKGKTVKLKDGRALTNGTGGNVVLNGIALREGVEKDDKEGYGEGIMFVSASTSVERKPQVTKRVNGAFVAINPEEGIPYAGCNVAVSVRFWPQDNKFGKRVNAELRAVVFTGHNTPFGAAPVNVEDEFGNVDIPEVTDGDTPPETQVASKPTAAPSDEW